MANWSSNHLPFTLRYCVENNSPPVCVGGEGGSGREEEGERIILLSCPVKTNTRSCLLERSSADGHHPSLGTKTKSAAHAALSGPGRTPSGCPLTSSVSALKAGAMFLLTGWIPHPALISMQRITQLLVRAPHPC